MTRLAGVNIFPVGRDTHNLVDEGSYFTTNNAQSGVVNAITGTAFSATNPFVTVFNRAVSGGVNLYLDFCLLNATATGASGTSLQCAVVLDFNGDRYTSGGTDITANIVNVNGNASNTSNAKVRIGNITAAAATGQARVTSGLRVLKTAIPAINDTYNIKFGGNESVTSYGPTAAVAFTNINVAKVVIPPQGNALIYIWLPSQAVTASAYAPELGWVER